jgi:dienelactone hydrolase
LTYFLCVLVLQFQLADTAPATTTLTINTGTGFFTGLLLEGNEAPNVGVIFFHGRGQHPDGDVVRQLRHSLHADGYTTLSLSNPVPVTGDTSFASYQTYEDMIDDQVFERATAAVNTLVARNNRIDTIVISGFSLGSRFATAVAAAWEQGLLTGIRPGVRLAGLLGAGMFVGTGGTVPTVIPAATTDAINVYDTLHNLELVSAIPVLDIYGDLDRNAAIPARARLAAYDGDPAAYTRAVLACPDFINATYYARSGSNGVTYLENHCHQLRNGYLTGGDAVNRIVAVRLRGAADAPLEATAGNWFRAYVPLAPPAPVRAPVLPFLPLILASP